MTHQRIHPKELFNQQSPEQVCILDVRTAAEVKSESLPNAIHIPLHELTGERLQQELAQQGKEADTVYLLCQSGKRAEAAADQLHGKLDQQLCIIEGGMNAVKQTKALIQQGQGMSLERQVRIAAGLLVMLGVGLGFTVHMGFFWLAGFVGAGLTVAGITNTCTMGMLIARMPWNK